MSYKIALFHPWIWLRGGGERVVLEILKNSKHDIDVFTLTFMGEQTFPEFQEYKSRIHEIETNFEMESFVRKGFIAGLKLIPKKIPFEIFGYDGMIISSGGIAELIAIRNHKLPVGIYCHTPLRILHDEAIVNDMRKRFRYRQFIYPQLAKFYGFFEKFAWNKLTLIMCNSKNVKRRIEKANLTELPINIVYPAVDIEIFKPKRKKKKYFLVAGRITYYKRPDLAIKAFEIFKKKHKGYKLIISGNTRKENKDFIDGLYRIASLCGDVEIKENVDDNEMIQLYRDATAMIFTAQNEDFGIVPLESMACGTPVVAVNEGGVKETVIQGKTGVLKNVNPESLAEGMEEILKLDCYDNCVNQAKQFTWKKFVEQFDELVDEWIEKEKGIK